NASRKTPSLCCMVAMREYQPGTPFPVAARWRTTRTRRARWQRRGCLLGPVANRCGDHLHCEGGGGGFEGVQVNFGIWGRCEVEGDGDPGSFPRPGGNVTGFAVTEGASGWNCSRRLRRSTNAYHPHRFRDGCRSDG